MHVRVVELAVRVETDVDSSAAEVRRKVLESIGDRFAYARVAIAGDTVSEANLLLGRAAGVRQRDAR